MSFRANPDEGTWIVIHVDGTIEPREARPEDRAGPRTVFNIVVGGYFEVVRLSGGLVLVANEEGNILNLPMNRRMLGFAGDVLLCTEAMVDGGDYREADLVPLTKTEARRVVAALEVFPVADAETAERLRPSGAWKIKFL